LFDSETGIVISKNMHKVQYIVIGIVLLLVAVVCFVQIRKRMKGKNMKADNGAS
jgi:hypothetical protein